MQLSFSWSVEDLGKYEMGRNNMKGLGFTHKKGIKILI
jgi:hypothetical protein